MAKVMVFGTFDRLHKGHLDFFRQAKKKGDFLIAVVARDSNVESVKGRKPSQDESARLEAVKNAHGVDLAVLGYEDDVYRIIEEQKPGVVCLGYDQNSYSEGLDEELKKRNIDAKIERLKPYKPEIFKTSKLNS